MARGEWQERLTDILTEMAESQTYPLSPKEASHGQKSAWLMPPQGWEVPLAGHLLGAGQRHDALPGVTRSSSEPWEVGSTTLWLQVRKLSAINLIYLFSPMPGVSYSRPVGFFSLHIIS